MASTSGEKAIGKENLKVIEWEDFQQELARLWSLSSALTKAKEKKDSLQQKIEPLIQLRAESLSRSNELEEMRQKVENRKLAMGNSLMRSKAIAEDVKNQEEKLSDAIRLLLGAGRARSSAIKQLQEANRLLAGERGQVHLRNLQKVLRMRQKYMTSQVSALYPVKVSIGPTHREKLDLSSSSCRSGNTTVPKTLNQGPLTIYGLQLTVLPIKKTSFFSDKKEVQKSATALGYVAHAVSLIASYLDVRLRYPLRFGGSHSYIKDYASSIEATSSDLSSSSIHSTNSKPAEFPLFLEGQDTTRAAYAMFLLNKDLEQLLNFIGANSLGPRHILANLKELLRIIQSPQFIDK